LRGISIIMAGMAAAKSSEKYRGIGIENEK
jgi:hypothetical protein